MEDDYGMIDGIINNGSRKEEKEEARSKSVMEKLQEKKEEAVLQNQNNSGRVHPGKEKQAELNLE